MPSGISRVTALGDLSPFGRSSKLNVYKNFGPNVIVKLSAKTIKGANIIVSLV